MKKIKSIPVLAGALLVLFAFSCTDLTEEPFGEITEENFDPTQDDIPRLVAPTYTNLRWFMACCYDYLSMQEGAADGYVTPGRPNGWGGPYVPYHRHQWTPDHLHVETGWNNMFGGINSANRVLHQVQNVMDISDEVLPGVVAELRAMRAFNYYLLLDNYGSVPIVTDFLDESLPEQSTRQEVYDFVVQELTEAIPDLDDRVDQSTYGRMHRYAALATLARVYLNAEVYTGSPQWEQVITVTDEIITSGQFQLETNYSAPFARTNENSPEIVFAIPYDEVFAGGNNFHLRNLAPVQQQSLQINVNPWGGSSSTPQYIDTYEEEDGRLDDTWFRGPQFDQQGNEVINFTRELPSLESTDFRHGYRPAKYEIYVGMTGASEVDFPVFRYSEVLMMQAEALLRTGQADDAATIVTQVRERAFADTDPSMAEVTGAELEGPSVYNYGNWEWDPDAQEGTIINQQGGEDIDFGRFLDELAWEFAVEGNRRQDLIRFGAFAEKRWFFKEPSDPCRQVFPIPLSAMEDNPNLEQRDNCF